MQPAGRRTYVTVRSRVRLFGLGGPSIFFSVYDWQADHKLPENRPIDSGNGYTKGPSSALQPTREKVSRVAVRRAEAQERCKTGRYIDFVITYRLNVSYRTQSPSDNFLSINPIVR